MCKNKAKHLAAAKASYKRNRPRILAERKINATHYLAYKRQWRETHRLHYRATARAWYHKNKERIRARARKPLPGEVQKRLEDWRKANPLRAKEAKQVSVQRRRARLKGRATEKINLADIYTRDKGRCAICGKHVKPDQVSLDHILPIAHGGGHITTNVRLTHHWCNVRRRDKTPAQLRIL